MVYLDKDRRTVTKAIAYNKARTMTPMKFLDDRISLHNFLFPDTAYELLGFTRDAQGRFCFVVRQPFIVEDGTVTRDELAADLKARVGFDRSPFDGRTFINDYYKLLDMHLGNAIRGRGGQIYLIDTVPSLNLPQEGFGGVSQYLPFRVEDVGAA